MAITSTEPIECTTTTDSFSSVTATMDISTKYTQLMQDSLAPDSLYTRAKETYYELFDKLNITEAEKAKIVADNITAMTTNLSSTAMQVALTWSKEERDGAYALAKAKADTELAIAQKEKVRQELCLITAQAAKVRTEIDSLVATTNAETALKDEQTKQVEAATYQSLADAYRKSGLVKITTDSDGIVKGTSDGDDTVKHGYTEQQTKNAERQRQSYEDSKLNHLVNSSATVIGQFMSAEVGFDADGTGPANRILGILEEGMAKLNTAHTLTPYSPAAV